MKIKTVQLSDVIDDFFCFKLTYLRFYIVHNIEIYFFTIICIKVKSVNCKYENSVHLIFFVIK